MLDEIVAPTAVLVLVLAAVAFLVWMFVRFVRARRLR